MVGNKADAVRIQTSFLNAAEYFRRMGMYNVSNLGVFGIRLLLVVVIQRIIPHHLVLCNLIARMLAGLVNFVIIDRLIFRKVRSQ